MSFDSAYLDSADDETIFKGVEVINGNGNSYIR